MYGGRTYTLHWDAPTAETVSIDVFEIDPAADKAVFIKDLRIWQTTDLGDANEEVLTVSIQRGFTTSGSGGAAPTSDQRMASDTAPAFTAECRNTTLATTGTPDILFRDGWMIRQPFDPRNLQVAEEPIFSPNAIVVVRLSAPADSITLDAYCVVEEIG